MKRALLISNSTLYGSGYLYHAEGEIVDFLSGGRKVAFVPFAAYDRGRYTLQSRQRLERMGFEVASVDRKSCS